MKNLFALLKNVDGIMKYALAAIAAIIAFKGVLDGQITINPQVKDQQPSETTT